MMPMPILQAEVDQPRGGRDGPDLITVFDAACGTDPKWSGTPGPFVYQNRLPLMDDLVDNRDSSASGTKALQLLGRTDPVDDLSFVWIGTMSPRARLRKVTSPVRWNLCKEAIFPTTRRRRIAEGIGGQPLTPTLAPNSIDPVRWRDYHRRAQLRAAE